MKSETFCARPEMSDWEKLGFAQKPFHNYFQIIHGKDKNLKNKIKISQRPDTCV